MRVFLCAFEGFYVAIPIHFVSSLMLYSAGVTQAVEYREQNGNTYFSLPHLFDLPRETIRHGIVLKDIDSGEDETDHAIENKNILLTTEVERESDIPEAEIYPMPKVLSGMGGSAMFSGIQFAASRDESDIMVLFLNPAYLVTRNAGGSPSCTSID